MIKKLLIGLSVVLGMQTYATFKVLEFKYPESASVGEEVTCSVKLEVLSETPQTPRPGGSLIWGKGQGKNLPANSFIPWTFGKRQIKGAVLPVTFSFIVPDGIETGNELRLGFRLHGKSEGKIVYANLIDTSGKKLGTILRGAINITAPEQTKIDVKNKLGDNNDFEVIIWPHRASKQLTVAQDIIQPFYVMVYDRKVRIAGTCELEVSVPDGWQVWQGSNPPPAIDEKQNIVKFPLGIRNHEKSNSKDYDKRYASGNLLLVIRPLKNAVSGAAMNFKWSKDNQVLASNKVDLELLPSLKKIIYPDNSKPLVGLWVNNPKFDTATMKELYRSFKRTGINYVIIDRNMFGRDAEMLKELDIKVFLTQWWDFREYAPGKVPPEAVSHLKNGDIDAARWSPTYMANGGEKFLYQVREVVKHWENHKNIYGFMLDYEPGDVGINADYGQASKIAFEKYLGETVGNWPKVVFEGGKLEEEWIDFRCSQSVAYVNWFKKIMLEQTPGIKLAVSSSGATGKKDDINRRLAVVDIDEVSTVCDSIHPQLYNWHSIAEKKFTGRFMDKLNLGNTTIKRSTKPVYPTVGSLCSNFNSSDDTKYLLTQILNWWLQGEKMEGIEVWQYFYGVDGRYMTMLNELAELFLDAGKMPDTEKEFSPHEILKNRPATELKVLCRRSHDKKKAWIGWFNLSNEPISVEIEANTKWEIKTKKTSPVKVEPWSVLLIKYATK